MATAASKPTVGDGAQHSYSSTVQMLQPNTEYDWQACASETGNNSSGQWCVGHDGQQSTIDNFTTLGASQNPTYAENFDDTKAPIYNSIQSPPNGGPAWPQTDGCPQMTAAYGALCNQTNTSGPGGSGGKSFGVWLSAGPYFGVANAADLQLPAASTQVCPAGGSGTCALTAAANGGPRWTTNQVGTTDYHSFAVYVPASGWAPQNSGSDGSDYLEVQELHFTNIMQGAPVKFNLHPDHMTISLDVGGCNMSGSGYCQYHSDADRTTYPTGSKELPGLYAIPPGKVVSGAWNEVIVAVHWATASSGFVQAWYRTNGAAQWQPSGPACTPSTVSGPCGSMSGIPTTQWCSVVTTTGTCSSSSLSSPPPTWDDGPEAYGFSVSSQYDVYEAGYASGPTFDSVAAQVP